MNKGLGDSRVRARLCGLAATPKCQRRAVAVSCDAKRAVQERHEAPDPQRIVQAVVTISAIGAAGSFFAQPAAAWGYNWRPRRHHRRLDEWQRQPNLGRYSKEALEARQRDRDAFKTERSHFSVRGGVFARVGDWAQNVKATVLQQDQKGRDGEVLSAGSSPFPAAGSRGFSPLVTGLLIVGLLLLGRWLLGVLKIVKFADKDQKKGRVVRDRGLGGKEVFIPEDGAPQVGAAQPASVSGRMAATDEYRGPPIWWSPPPSIHVEPSVKRQAKEEAQTIVNRLCNAKIGGQDYDVKSLVGLRQVLGETGERVDAKTQRDPIFRAAADAAANSAAEQTNGLGGLSPGKFLTGLARDLGVGEEEAVNMVNSVVASRARSALITACAGYREGNNNEVLVQLLKLAGLITSLPLPPQSAHAEMVASGLQQRATMPERQAIFLTYGCMDPQSAGLIAEMLGFQPKQVLPQLEKHIEDGRRASTPLTPQPAY